MTFPRLPGWAQPPTGHGCRLHRHPSESGERPEHLPSCERADDAARRAPAPGVVVERLNRLLTGWANYFTLGQVSPAYVAIDRHTTRRLRQWLCRKHKVRTGKAVRFPADRLWSDYGLTHLAPRTAESVGLDYQMGFFHRPRAGRPSLALDLAEELRALTDRFVVSLIRRRQVGAGSFVHMPGGGVYLSDDGRTRLIKEWEAHKEAEIHHQIFGRPIERWALPSVQATLLARHLRGDLPAYPPFVLL